MGLFGGARKTSPSRREQPARTPEWDERDRLAKEKEVLGFYLSSHPLAEHQQTLAPYCSHTTVGSGRAETPRRGDARRDAFGDQLAHTKNPKPGSPSRYAMFDLEDTEGMIRCIVWPDQFVNYEELIKPDAIVSSAARSTSGRAAKRPT